MNEGSIGLHNVCCGEQLFFEPIGGGFVIICYGRFGLIQGCKGR